MARIAVAAPLSLDRIGDLGTSWPGGATYSALAAAAFGHDVLVVGPVGADAAALIGTHLSDAGVDTSGLLVGDWHTRAVGISEPDEVLPQTTWVDDEGDPRRYDAAVLAPLLHDRQVVLTYGHAPELALSTLASAPRSASTAVDLQDVDDPALVARLAEQTEWVLVSWPSAAAFAGSDTASGVVAALRSSGARNVVLKLGPGGALLAPVDAPFIQVPALLGAFRATVGAGDAFNAVFLAELADGVQLGVAAMKAAAAAAQLVSSFPPVFGDRERIEAIRTSRLEAFSTPEMRRGVRVALVAPARTAAERHFVRRLTDTLHAHEFPPLLVTIPAGEAENARHALDAALLVCAVADGCEPSLRGWIAEAEVRRIPVLGFWSSGGEPPESLTSARLVARDEREWLTGLYAFAAKGGVGLDELRRIL